MDAKASAIKFTYQDLLLFPDDGKRHELIDGDRYVTPAPKTKHQRISRNLLIALQTFAARQGLGEVLDAPTDVVLSDLDVVEPDLLFISAARRAIVTETNIQGAPDLVIEILSEASRRTDEIIKRKLYERHSVPEYWIVDPELETIKVYRRGDAGYDRPTELSRETGDQLTTPLLPGLTLSLADIFP